MSHLEALLEVKKMYADLVSVQIVAFPQQGYLRHADARALFRDAFQLSGADVMGCASNLDRDSQGRVDFCSHIDGMFALAAESDVDLDIHADLGIPERVELDDLEVVHAARRTIEYGYQGRVTAGHACALDSALPDVAAQAIEWIRLAGMSQRCQPAGPLPLGKRGPPPCPARADQGQRAAGSSATRRTSSATSGATISLS